MLTAGCASRAGMLAGHEEPANERRLRAHMQFLASDALNGRGSGTRDEHIAAAYVAAHFARLGLQPVGSTNFVHEIRIERSELAGAVTLSAGGRQFTHLEEMLVTSQGAARLAGPLQKFTTGTTVRSGAVVLLPATNAPSAALTTAAQIVLALETEAQQKRRLAGPSSPFPPLRVQWVVGTPRRAVVALEKSAYDAVAAMSEGTDVSLSADVNPPVTALTWNSIGQLLGTTRRDEIIVLSAHHDHVGSRAATNPAEDTIYNGADDDASGAIAVMELAAALAARPSERTVLFATFGSEETGGQGSSHFIDASGIDLRNIVANLQFEMIGRPDPKVPPQTLWLTGYERSNLGETLAARGARLVADPHPEQSFFTRSDNIRFARRGVVAHTVSSYGLHKDYHEPSDEFATIDFAHMARAIQSLVEPIRWLANAAFRPQWTPGMAP
jgi:hypothetical protein